MIKEAIEKIQKMAGPTQIEVGGRTFSTGMFTEVRPLDPHRPDALELSTLTGLADYIRHDVDGIVCGGVDLFIHVETPQIVHLMQDYDEEVSCRRTIFARARAYDLVERWNPHGGVEDTIASLRANFAPTEDRDRLLACLGNMAHETAVEYGDDGVTPSVTVRQGLSMKGKTPIPPIVMLAPYHSFREIDQVEVPYAVRIHGGGKDPIQIRLIDASGGSWRNQAILRIKAWLEDNIDGDIPVLA